MLDREYIHGVCVHCQKSNLLEYVSGLSYDKYICDFCGRYINGGSPKRVIEEEQTEDDVRFRMG